ncbi:MAG: LysM peptidoglycan-binding domain-containing protein [Vicinamibacterales bacterium]
MLDKYKDLEGLAASLGIRDFSMKEADGKVKISGKTTYALERDLFWDAIKKHAGWQDEVAADVRADRTDIHGIHVVKPGDSLSKIAKVHLDDANRYMDIFSANKDKLKDPNMIHPGQELVIPNR